MVGCESEALIMHSGVSVVLLLTDNSNQAHYIAESFNFDKPLQTLTIIKKKKQRI